MLVVRAADDLLAVLAHWQLGEVRAVHKSPLGTMNDTFIVTTSDRLAVLRRHRLSRCRPMVKREHALMGSARERGVPCPEVLWARSGERLIEEDGRLFSLFEHAPGRQVRRCELIATQASSLGRALAHLHDAIADYAPVRDRPTGEDRGTAALPTSEETAARLQRLLTVVQQRRKATEVDQWAKERLRSRLAWLEANPGAPPAVSSRESRPLHGDYQESNVFFDDRQRVCAVLDWDNSQYGSAAGEMVRAMALIFDLDRTLCQAFLDGYRELRQADLDDLCLEAELYSWRKLHDTWLYDTVYLQGESRPSRFIAPGRYVPFIDRWNDVQSTLH
jgi:homoserine kinase type II